MQLKKERRVKTGKTQAFQNKEMNMTEKYTQGIKIKLPGEQLVHKMLFILTHMQNSLSSC